MKKNQWIAGLVVVAALAGLLVWGRDRIHFDFHVFGSQIALADWRKIAMALACIYLCYLLRAARWAMLIKPLEYVLPVYSNSER